MSENRWRVVLEGISELEGDLDDPATMSRDHAAMAQFATRNPGASLSFERHGPEIILSITVTAPNAPTSLVIGAALLWEVIPRPPKTTVMSFEAHPLKAEPDFILSVRSG